MESKTPRTDAFARIIYGLTEFVEAKLARQLETELADKDKRLAEALAEIERLKLLLHGKDVLLMLKQETYAKAIAKRDKLIEQMREALRAWMRTPNIPLHEAIKVTEAALEAAERGEG